MTNKKIRKMQLEFFKNYCRENFSKPDCGEAEYWMVQGAKEELIRSYGHNPIQLGIIEISVMAECFAGSHFEEG